MTEEQKPGLIERKPIHKGRIVDLSMDTVRFPNGKTGQLEMIRHSGAAAVLPVLSELDADDPQILLIRQYRYAAEDFLYLLEVPAGRPDQEGEDWEHCARRELQEETGLVAEKLIPLTAIHTTPGFTDEKIHLFLATGLKPGKHRREKDEFMEVHTKRWSEIMTMTRTGETSRRRSSGSASARICSSD